LLPLAEGDEDVRGGKKESRVRALKREREKEEGGGRGGIPIKPK
jgi:hypothetical protein